MTLYPQNVVSQWILFGKMELKKYKKYTLYKISMFIHIYTYIIYTYIIYTLFIYISFIYIYIYI